MRASDNRCLPSRCRVLLEVEIPRLQPWGTVNENDYVVICDGDKYIDGFTGNTRPGTVVVTIKTRKD